MISFIPFLYGQLVGEKWLQGQITLAPQVDIDSTGTLPSFMDSPHYQRLTPAHVAGNKHVFQAGLISVCPTITGLDVAPIVNVNPQSFQQPLLHWMDKAHGEENHVGFQGKFGSLDIPHFPLAIRTVPGDLDTV